MTYVWKREGSLAPAIELILQSLFIGYYCNLSFRWYEEPIVPGIDSMLNVN